MAKRYVMIRMPKEIYDHYAQIKMKMENDITKKVGAPLKLSMNNVFNAVVNPKLNNNFIEIDLTKLVKMGKRK